MPDSGARITTNDARYARMMSIIAGCTMLCESFRSEQADPIARKIDPNISEAQTMNTRNQPMSTGSMRSSRPNDNSA